jgi:hypothetical protein
MAPQYPKPAIVCGSFVELSGDRSREDTLTKSYCKFASYSAPLHGLYFRDHIALHVLLRLRFIAVSSHWIASCSVSLFCPIVSVFYYSSSILRYGVSIGVDGRNPPPNLFPFSLVEEIYPTIDNK